MFGNYTVDGVLNEMFSKARMKLKKIKDKSKETITKKVEEKRNIEESIEFNEDQALRAEVILERMDEMFDVDVQAERAKRNNSSDDTSE